MSTTYDKSIERCDMADCNAIAQDLYDRLTCAGLRHDLWPTDAESYCLDTAFAILSTFMDAWRVGAES